MRPMALFSVAVFLYPSKKSSQRGGVMKIVVTRRIKSGCLGLLRAKEISRESVVETIIYLCFRCLRVFACFGFEDQKYHW
jgi:hypothetical protein